jgi:predicted transcriptional regulator of viral defense system
VGVSVRRQQVRIRPDTNYRLPVVLKELCVAGDGDLTPAGLAERLGTGPDYAYHLPAALIEEGRVERVKRGVYCLVA